MKISLPIGKYVVAVSGGVDSVVLLHLLTQSHKAENLIVAHFDHGIRPESAHDAEFVKQQSAKLGVVFELGQTQLGPQASEETARNARYDFLKSVMQKHSAIGIVTAHHQDDVLETILLHVKRGTGRHGLDPMRRTAHIKRPLLGYTKAQLLQYAQENKLQWVEDETNNSQKYTRNMLRAKLTNAPAEVVKQLTTLHNIAKATNNQIEPLLQAVLHWAINDSGALKRSAFAVLPYAVQKEVMMEWLVRSGIQEINTPMLQRAVLATTTGKIGTKIDLNNKKHLYVQKNVVVIL